MQVSEKLLFVERNRQQPNQEQAPTLDHHRQLPRQLNNSIKPRVKLPPQLRQNPPVRSSMPRPRLYHQHHHLYHSLLPSHHQLSHHRLYPSKLMYQWPVSQDLVDAQGRLRQELHSQPKLSK